MNMREIEPINWLRGGRKTRRRSTLTTLENIKKWILEFIKIMQIAIYSINDYLSVRFDSVLLFFFSLCCCVYSRNDPSLCLSGAEMIFISICDIATTLRLPARSLISFEPSWETSRMRDMKLISYHVNFSKMQKKRNNNTHIPCMSRYQREN